TSLLLPYTTLFRSDEETERDGGDDDHRSHPVAGLALEPESAGWAAFVQLEEGPKDVRGPAARAPATQATSDHGPTGGGRVTDGTPAYGCPGNLLTCRRCTCRTSLRSGSNTSRWESIPPTWATTRWRNSPPG